jgi:hypothetical protein
VVPATVLLLTSPATQLVRAVSPARHRTEPTGSFRSAAVMLRRRPRRTGSARRARRKSVKSRLFKVMSRRPWRIRHAAIHASL